MSYKAISLLNPLFTQYSENEYFYNLTGNKIAEYDAAINNVFEVNTIFKQVSGFKNGILYIENANAVNLINVTFQETTSN